MDVQEVLRMLSESDKAEENSGFI